MATLKELRDDLEYYLELFDEETPVEVDTAARRLLDRLKEMDDAVREEKETLKTDEAKPEYYVPKGVFVSPEESATAEMLAGMAERIREKEKNEEKLKAYLRGAEDMESCVMRYMYPAKYEF